MWFLFFQESKGEDSSPQDKQPTYPFPQADTQGKRWPALHCALWVYRLPSSMVESSTSRGRFLRAPCHGSPQVRSGALRPSSTWCLASPLPPCQRERHFPPGRYNAQGARSYRLHSMVCGSWSSSCWTGIKWFLWLMAEMSFKLIVWRGFDF